MMQWWMWAGGPGLDLWNRDDVQDYFSSLPLTEINMSLRRNFLMFLHGCHLHDLPMLPHAAAVIGLRSVIKCMSMPYFDRAVMEFIHHTRGWWWWWWLGWGVWSSARACPTSIEQWSSYITLETEVFHTPNLHCLLEHFLKNIIRAFLNSNQKTQEKIKKI